MTVKQIQHLLGYLGYYTGAPDGIWGRLSEEATRAFQQDYGLEPDGVCGTMTQKMLVAAIAGTASKVERPAEAEKTATDKPKTGTFWDDIRYFTREEFRCQCKGKYCNGFPVEPQEKMVRTVDEIRRRLGIPVSIVDAGGSGVRCPRHNSEVGGMYNSEHLYGRAADLHSAASPERMKAIAEEVMGNTGGIGLYSWGIHVDTGKYSRWNG